MNIKKYSLKTMCAVLACTTFLSSMLAASATDVIVTETAMDETIGSDISDSNWTTEENSCEDIKVTYKQSSSYFVTIPKEIALDTKKQAAYSVKVSGDIDPKQRAYVAPVDGISETEKIDFYMKEVDDKKTDVVANITQNKSYWNSEEVANSYEETNNSISAPDLTAGTWEGTFQMEIRLEEKIEHEHIHDYVDGKCECGAVDPNHEHVYEGGTCTICGKNDPYEIAPATAYSNWDYSLDDENNIITLSYYKGSETDVIVYANYVIEGKTYKTQLASNKTDASATEKYMFNGYAYTNCEKIKSIAFSDSIDTRNVTNMINMFRCCKSLTSLDLGGFDTSNVKDMGGMFCNCNSLVSLNIGNFDTGSVTSMASMFNSCTSLISLELGSFDTSKVTSMHMMFYNCKSLISLDLENFNTSNVTTMYDMFWQCNLLSNLNISNFDTSNVTNMCGMFYCCKSLTSLDLSSFDTSNVRDMGEMFYGCITLKTIYATRNKWSTTKATANNGTYNMFYYCGTTTGNNGTSSVTYK